MARRIASDGGDAFQSVWWSYDQLVKRMPRKKQVAAEVRWEREVRRGEGLTTDDQERGK